MRSPRALIQEITGVRSQENTRLFLMMVYLLIVIACYTTTKAVRDSLFTVEVGPAQLPYVYVLIAAVMVVVSSAYSRAVSRLGLRRLIQFTSISSVVILLLFWMLPILATMSAYYALYVWVSIFGVVTASQVWALASEVFDAREARRVFGWIGVGGIIGGILGGALTRWVAPRFGTETLLPICAFLIFWTLIIAHILGRHQVAPEPRAQEAAPELKGNWAIFQEVLKSRHLSFLVVLLGCGVIVEAFADYTYKVVALNAFSSKDQLTAFFGTLSSYGGLLALLVQMVLTSRILKRFGVGPAILLFPSAMLGAFLIIALQPALWAVAFLRLIDAGLSYSIHRSGMELLYVPIDAQQRSAIKGFIDMFVDRVGRAAGGVVLLVLTTVGAITVTGLSLTASAFLIVWIGAAVAVRKQYIQAFRHALEKKTIEPEALDIRITDWGTVGTLVRALSSDDPRKVLYALDLLGNVEPRRWRSHWPALLEHPSSAVRARTLAILAVAGEKGLGGHLLTPRLRDSDVRVRIEAIHYSAVTSRRPTERLREFLASEDPQVVHAAVRCMEQHHIGNPNDLDEEFLARTSLARGEQSEYLRAAAASALNVNWTGSESAIHQLEELLADTSHRVVTQAIQTSGEVRFEGAIPALLERLSESRYRKVVREALLKFGEEIVPVLASQLSDPDASMRAKIRIPHVLAHTGRQSAVDVLLDMLQTSDHDLDYRVIRALSHARSSAPHLVFDGEKVTFVIDYECRQHRHLRLCVQAVETMSTAAESTARSRDLIALLLRALRERMDEIVERVFRLLGLIHAPEDMYATYLSHRVKPELRASAIEFLDNVLHPPLKDWVVPLLDDGETIVEETEDRPGSAELSIQMLMVGEDHLLRQIAAELAGELGIPEPAGEEIHAEK